MTGRRGYAATGTALLVCALLAGCTGADGEPDAAPSGSSPTASGEPAELTFAVYGPERQVEAYQAMAREFSEANPEIEVEVTAAPDREEHLAVLQSSFDSADAPDVFLLNRLDLPQVREEGWSQPVDQLLGERGVDFGDGYEREGLNAFSEDQALQCMPHDVSPLVVYYNTDLVDLATTVEEGEEPPNATDGWTFDQFTEAARSVGSRRVKGVYVDPTLEQLAPFVWSAGGGLVDDTEQPTRLTLSEGDSRDALETVLDVLREPRITPSAAQVAAMDPLQRFQEGRLGMILGYRSLTPALRDVEDLEFDVMPIPRLGSYRTIAQVTGYCIAADSEFTEQAADFVTYAVGEGERTVTRAGYTLPANLVVAHSAAFSAGEEPESSFVFNEGVRRSDQLPAVPGWSEVELTTQSFFDQLLYTPVLDLDRMLQRIDEVSELVLAEPEDASEDE